MTGYDGPNRPDVLARATHDPGSELSLVPTVVEAVARARDEDPAELPALHRVVEPDALDALVDGGREGLRVVFAFDDHEVVVRGDGEVLVQEPTGGS
jgi:hypothetical protein